MSNSTTGNVWKIDTAGSIRTAPFYCVRMWWAPAAANDDLEVKDAGGNTIWKQRGIAG